jgi:putative alpha-1,2-mannosidase
MSSWAVLSMMGLYTVDPASTAYEIFSPAFRKIVIHLRAPYPGKTFVIQASHGAWSKPYIQSVRLNGKPLRRCWLWAREITRGGKMDFQLGKKPNKQWGAAPADRPPSLGQ